MKNLILHKYNEQIGNTFGKGDTAQTIPQTTRLHSMTFDGKAGNIKIYYR